MKVSPEHGQREVFFFFFFITTMDGWPDTWTEG